MGLVRMGPPQDLLIKFLNQFNINNFVETGTYYGGTTTWASQHFNKVFTIENSKKLYQETTTKLKHIQNIEFILGDSRNELKKIVDKLDGATIFWLDAHWSGGLTYGEVDQCPIIEEINILNQLSFDSFILIDDARLFTSPPQPPHKVEQWSDITTIINALNSGNQDRYIVIIEDVIIAVPIFAREALVKYCQNVNAKAWEEYGRQINTSNLQKAIELILLDIKQQLRKIKKFLSNRLKIYKLAR